MVILIILLVISLIIIMLLIALLYGSLKNCREQEFSICMLKEAVKKEKFNDYK